MTSISLNLFYILTNSPIQLYKVINIDDLDPNIAYFIGVFVVSCFCGIFILRMQLIVNNLVRAEFFKILDIFGQINNNFKTNFNEKTNFHSIA
jgi:hypothetical protein